MAGFLVASTFHWIKSNIKLKRGIARRRAFSILFSMKTKYYCKTCEEHIEADEVPNMNRRHHCGTIMRIIEHIAYGAR
jgi:hypothetical protein